MYAKCQKLVTDNKEKLSTLLKYYKPEIKRFKKFNKQSLDKIYSIKNEFQSKVLDALSSKTEEIINKYKNIDTTFKDFISKIQLIQKAHSDLNEASTSERTIANFIKMDKINKGPSN